MKNLKYLMLLFPLALTACGDSGPSKQEISDLMAYEDDYIREGDAYIIDERKCTKHENDTYSCSVTYHKKSIPELVENDTIYFRKIKDKWGINWHPH